MTKEFKKLANAIDLLGCKYVTEKQKEEAREYIKKNGAKSKQFYTFAPLNIVVVFSNRTQDYVVIGGSLTHKP